MRREFTFISGSPELLDYNQLFLADSPQEKLDGLDPKITPAFVWMRCSLHGCLRVRRESGCAVAAYEIAGLASPGNRREARGARGRRAIPPTRRDSAFCFGSGQGILGIADHRRGDGRSVVRAEFRHLIHAGFGRKIIYDGACAWNSGTRV